MVLKMKKIIVGILLIAFSVIGHTKPSANGFKVTPPFGKTALGRCHMDYCSWGKVKNKKIIASSNTSINVEATILGGESPMSATDKVKWNSTTHKLIAICSKQNPSIIIDDQITQLDVKDYSAIEESDVNMYFLICHDYANGAYDGAKKFKY